MVHPELDVVGATKDQLDKDADLEAAPGLQEPEEGDRGT